MLVASQVVSIKGEHKTCNVFAVVCGQKHGQFRPHASRGATLIANHLHLKVLQRPLEFTQYACAQITKFAAAHGLTRLMGYTGVCWDNSMVEYEAAHEVVDKELLIA